MTTSLSILGYTKEQADFQINANLTLEQRMSRKEFDNFNEEDVVRLCRLINNSKITSRFLERWIAKAVGGECNPKSPENSKDYGDLLLGDRQLGKDNIELKSVEKIGETKVGGGQCRFFEDIPYYIFLQFDPYRNDSFQMWLLSKEEIHKEIFEYKVCRCTPSQVSGQTAKKSDEEVRQLVQESFDGDNTILWGFSIDSDPKFTRKEPRKPKKEGSKAAENYCKKVDAYNKAKAEHDKKEETLTRWCKYKVTLDDLRNWPELRKKRYGI